MSQTLCCVCYVGRPVSLSTIAVINSARQVLERARQKSGMSSPVTPRQSGRVNAVSNAGNIMAVSDLLYLVEQMLKHAVSHLVTV